ncbi:MAG TPA: tRNA epoxyqueuosine(34) reductase QueG [Alphaproteobacteria bacterium]|nr:tRNA epoxyqueuosine(34) reductase QueG [Alphaproteobacteria bacterium]
MRTSTSERQHERDDAGDALKQAIRDKARALGFDAVGFAAPDSVLGSGKHLRDFLAAGRHGDMDWLEAKADRRADPRTLWPEVETVIALGLNYGPPGRPLEMLKATERGNVSVYARGRDYHDVVKKRLKQLGRWLADEQGRGIKPGIKVFVDTAPVLEKPLAAAAGLGWQGKHTNLVSREFGSWLFLGVIFTTLRLAPDAAHADRCGSCRRCLDICPTDAFPGPYQLDARRCISYLTIEHKGHIDAGFRRAMGNRIFGCDDCLAVCPWNRFARLARETALWPRAELTAPRLADLLRLDDAGFRSLFAGTPVKRLGHTRFLRNVLIAAGNSGSDTVLPPVLERLDDESALVRAMAVWALGELAPARFAAERQRRLPAEPDPDVRAEWQRSAIAT